MTQDHKIMCETWKEYYLDYIYFDKLSNEVSNKGERDSYYMIAIEKLQAMQLIEALFEKMTYKPQVEIRYFLKVYAIEHMTESEKQLHINYII